jgi:hypothetical protein
MGWFENRLWAADGFEGSVKTPIVQRLLLHLSLWLQNLIRKRI